MLTASEYRKRSRKTVTLPSGGEVIIRKLNAEDYLSAGEIPIAFQEAITSGSEAETEKMLESHIELAKRLSTLALTRAIVSMRVVDKDPRDCKDDEISASEIDQNDRAFLLNEIAAMNKMDAEAGKSIRRFPEEPGTSGDSGSDGSPVREAAVGDPATPA